MDSFWDSFSAQAGEPDPVLKGTHAHSNRNQHTISFSIFAGQRGAGHHGYAGVLQLRQSRSILLIWIHSGILSGHRRVNPTLFLKGTHAHSNNNQHTISFSIFACQRGVGHHGYAGALQLRQSRSILLIWIHSGILSGHRRVDPTPFLQGTHAHSNNNHHTISFSIFAGRRGVGHHGYAGALQLNHSSKLFFVLDSFGILLACAGPGGSRVPIHITPFLIVSLLLMYCFLSYTRYCFVYGLLCTNQYYSLRTHPLFRYPTTPCHRPHYCTI